jgi:hypothetical protein
MGGQTYAGKRVYVQARAISRQGTVPVKSSVVVVEQYSQVNAIRLKVSVAGLHAKEIKARRHCALQASLLQE